MPGCTACSIRVVMLQRICICYITFPVVWS
jgi:hypothetical protein